MSVGFGEILPAFTEFSRKAESTSRPFNFGLGDLRDVEALKGLYANANSVAGGSLEMLDVLPGTQGLRELNVELAAIDSFELRRDTDPENIILCCGACDGLLLSLLTATVPGDGILFPVPSFPYWWIFSDTGRESIPLYFDDPAAYRASFGDRVREAIQKKPSIRAVILNEPQNPMGVSLEEDQLAILRDLIEDGRIVLIVDDVARSFADSTLGWWRVIDPNGVIVVDSFTKRYGAPGLRLGWLRLRDEWRVRARNISANWRVGVATPVSKLGLWLIEALGKGEAVAQEIEQRREILVQTVRKGGDAFPLISTEGRGVYALIDSRCDNKEPGLALKSAAAEAGVILMGPEFLFPPGFEAEATRWMLRLSIAGESRIEEGLNRLYEVGSQFLAGSGGGL